MLGLLYGDCCRVDDAVLEIDCLGSIARMVVQAFYCAGNPLMRSETSIEEIASRKDSRKVGDAGL